MKYTKKQAEQKAQMVVSQLGLRILAACRPAAVSPAFLAGKIGVEAGVKNGKINESATRFEAHHYKSLKSLRDNGYYISGKRKVKKTSFNGIKRSQIIDASDAALKALSRSYGVSQIMGWHMINNLKGTIADLRDPQKHLVYTIQLMMLTSGNYLKKKDYEAALRIWNTGKATGETYDPDYCDNAELVMHAAKPMLLTVSETHPALPTLPSIEHGTEDVDLVLHDAEIEEKLNLDEDDVDEPADDGQDPVEDEPAAPTTSDTKPDPEPAPDDKGDGNKIADNINIGTGAADQTPAPPKNEPKDVPMNAPPPEGIKEKVSRWWTGLGFGVPTGAGVVALIGQAFTDGKLDIKEALQITISTLVAVLPYIALIYVVYLIHQTVKTVMIQWTFGKRMEINGNPDLNNIKLNQPPADQKEPTEVIYWWQFWRK